MKKVLEESLFGPERFHIADDYSSINPALVPDIISEMNYFRKKNQLSNMVQFRNI